MIIGDNTKVINETSGTNVSINTTNINIATSVAHTNITAANINISTSVAHTDITAANINISTSVAHTDITAANIKVVNSSYATDIGASVINISNTSGNYITVNSSEIRVFSPISYTTIRPGDVTTRAISYTTIRPGDVTTSAITTYTVIPKINGIGSIGTSSCRYGAGYINDLTSNNISPITNIEGNIGSYDKQYNYAYVNCISSSYHYNRHNHCVTTNIPLSLYLTAKIDHGNSNNDNNDRPYDVIDFLTLFFYSVDKQFLRYLYSEPSADANTEYKTYNMQSLQSGKGSKAGLYLNFGTGTDARAFLNLPMDLFTKNSDQPLSETFSRDQMLGGTKEFIIPDILPVTFDANYLGDISGATYNIYYENGQHQLVLPAGGPYLISCSDVDTTRPGYVSIYPVSNEERKIHVDCTADIIVWRRGYGPSGRGAGSSISDEHLYSGNRGTVNGLDFGKLGY